MTSLSRFSASSLDLSRLDRAAMWPVRSFQDILDARMYDLKALFIANGIDYDVDALETDPSKYLQESSAYRELLIRNAIDDAQAAVLLAFATGIYLDRLGELHGTARATGELDERYRARIQLAPEAFSSAGTTGGYLYHVMSVSTEVRDVAVNVIDKGTRDVSVEITVLSTTGTGEPSAALMRAIQDRLEADDIRLTTDSLRIRPARIINYDLTARLTVGRGPDPGAIQAIAATSLQTVANRYKRVGGDVPFNALSAALYVPGVERVTMAEPTSDVVTLRFQAAHLLNVALSTEVGDA